MAVGAGRGDWVDRVPSLALVDGGALLWILAGDAARVEAKYGDRGGRFLLLEAGHLMQNLCLLSASLGLSTVPLGGALEPEIARSLGLPPGDALLYVGVCGGNI
jgi:nitroreductase